MTLENIRLTSEALWRSALLIALIDVGIVALLVRRIKTERFHQLKWALAGSAAIFWGIVGVVVLQVFWDVYYRYFFSDWLHSGGILLFAAPLFALFALAFHWLALRLPGNPVVNFCLLCGLESALEHLWGIYGLGILKVPILQEVSPISILAFAVPEYILYWCIVMGLAVLMLSGWRRWVSPRQKPAGAG